VLQGGLVMAKSGRLELGEYLRALIISLYSTTLTYLASRAIEFGEKRKIRAVTPFKVIEVGINRKPVCYFLIFFLLVINSNWHPSSYRFRVIAAYCSNFGHCIFEPPFGGLRDYVRCSS